MGKDPENSPIISCSFIVVTIETFINPLTLQWLMNKLYVFPWEIDLSLPHNQGGLKRSRLPYPFLYEGSLSHVEDYGLIVKAHMHQEIQPIQLTFEKMNEEFIAVHQSLTPFPRVQASAQGKDFYEAASNVFRTLDCSNALFSTEEVPPQLPTVLIYLKMLLNPGNSPLLHSR